MEYNIILRDGDLVVDSLTVAEKFGKEHKRILEDIRKRIADIQELGDEPNFGHIFLDGYFSKGSYQDRYGRKTPLYYMSQKGFSFLVMSYTGKEATKYKLAYIEQFERMRQALQEGEKEKPFKLTAAYIRQGLAERPPFAKVDWNNAGDDHYCFGIYAILRLYGYADVVSMSFMKSARALVLFYGLAFFEEVTNYCSAKDKLHLSYILKVLANYFPSEVPQMVDESVFGLAFSNYIPNR